MTSHRRGPWSQAEDAYLCRLVHTQGALNWVRIAHLIGSRSPKQCRERYHQNLKPTLNHEPISPEEGQQIERMVGEMGKRWAEIARRLHGRSDNAVKNWWNGSMNRRRRLVLRRRISPPQPARFDGRYQPSAFPKSLSDELLTITSSESMAGTSTDEPFPSPVVSEASRAESIDRTPSLASESYSTSSISPRIGTFPGLQLPPFHRYCGDPRYPPPPEISFEGNAVLGETEAADFAPQLRPHVERKAHAVPPLSASFSQELWHTSSLFHSGRPFEPRPQLLTATPTPVQLPPLQLSSRTRSTDLVARDSRMHLSSLLV